MHHANLRPGPPIPTTPGPSDHLQCPGTAWARKELAADGDVRFVRLDLTDTASIQAAQEHVAEQSGTLHVTQAFLPLVRKAEAGHIVNLSSSMGSLSVLTAPDQPLAPFGMSYAYSTSKTLVSTLTGWFALN